MLTYEGLESDVVLIRGHGKVEEHELEGADVVLRALLFCHDA